MTKGIKTIDESVFTEAQQLVEKLTEDEKAYLIRLTIALEGAKSDLRHLLVTQIDKYALGIKKEGEITPIRDRIYELFMGEWNRLKGFEIIAALEMVGGFTIAFLTTNEMDDLGRGFVVFCLAVVFGLMTLSMGEMENQAIDRIKTQERKPLEDIIKGFEKELSDIYHKHKPKAYRIGTTPRRN